MYLIRRVFRCKPGTARRAAEQITKIGKAYENAGQRSPIRVYTSGGTVPGPANTVYMDHIQLVDTPPFSNQSTRGRLYGLLRTSDLFVIVADLSVDPISQVHEVFLALQEWGFRLLGKSEGREEDHLGLVKPVIVAGNKADIPGALEQFQLL